MNIYYPYVTYLGAGSNLGNRQQHLRHGLKYLLNNSCQLIKESGPYKSAPWHMTPDAPEFLNEVWCVQTQLRPLQLLKLLQDAETAAGRGRSKSGGFESRTLDLDLLLYDNCSIQLPGLQVPHPHIASRRFVLAPLAELQPLLMLPGTGSTVELLLLQCIDEGEVERIAPS